MHRRLERPKSHLRDPRHLVREVITDEAYEKAPTRSGCEQAFATAAMVLTELCTSDSDYRTHYGDQLHVASTLLTYVDSQLLLDDGGLSETEEKKHKTNAVIFNHALRALIDNDPSADFREVHTYLRNLYRSLRPHDERQATIDDRLASTLMGMATEIHCEQLAGELGYETKETDVRSDLTGIDQYLLIDGRSWRVDYKLSEHRAEKARAHDWNGKRLIVSSPVTPQAIVTYGFRLPPAIVTALSRRFQNQIDAEIERCQRIHKRQYSYQ